MSEKSERVREKLTKETALIKQGNTAKDHAISAMRQPVMEQLISFADQSGAFADAILQSQATYADCIGKVAEGVQYSLSDLEAYCRAVKFYLPDADVECNMKIRTKAASDKVISVNFMDLLEVDT